MESEKSFLMRLLRRLGSCQHALSEQNKVSCLDYKVKNLIYAGAFLDIIGKLTDRILAIDELQKKGKEMGWKAGKEFGQADGHLDLLSWLQDKGNWLSKALGIIIISRREIASMYAHDKKIWDERAKARYEYE